MTYSHQVLGSKFFAFTFFLTLTIQTDDDCLTIQLSAPEMIYMQGNVKEHELTVKPNTT